MTDQNAIRDDIAFLRALAEDGQAGPMRGGSILIAAGLIFAAASLASWGVIVSNQAGSGIVFPIIWFGAAALFMAVMTWLKRRMPSGSPNGRAAGVVWTGAGFAIFFIVISLMVLASRLHNWDVMASLPSIILAIYGAAWLVGAIVSRIRWVCLVAAGAFAMALVSGWCATDPATLYLLYAASLVGLLALPGYIFTRLARAA